MYAILVLGYELLHDKTQHFEVVPSKHSDLNFFLHQARTLIWWFDRLTWISSVPSQIIGFVKHGLLLVLFCVDKFGSSQQIFCHFVCNDALCPSHVQTLSGLTWLLKIKCLAQRHNTLPLVSHSLEISSILSPAHYHWASTLLYSCSLNVHVQHSCGVGCLMPYWCITLYLLPNFVFIYLWLNLAFNNILVIIQLIVIYQSYFSQHILCSLLL